MFLKGIFVGRSPLYHLLVLIILTLIASVIFSSVSAVILIARHGMSADLMNYPDLLRWLQLLTSLGTFLVPALTFGYLCSTDMKEYLNIRHIPDIQILLLTILCLLSLAPVLNLTGYLNNLISLPSFLEPVENWMREQEDKMEAITSLLLEDNSAMTFAINILVIAIAAGIAEEFFFRGALQRIIFDWIQKPHTAIWVTAIIFSAIHMQFYGFLPRLLLGAFFGYLVYWSKSIWLPVFIHFLNNSIAVIGMSNSSLKENEFLNGPVSDESLLTYVLFACIGLLIFIPLVQSLRKRCIHHFPIK